MKTAGLASGSKGNAYIVESQGTALLIDCGISHRQLAAKIKAAGFDEGAIAGVLLTHEHTDHASGLESFRKHHPDTPFFANALTADAIDALCPDAGGFCIFENAQEFELGPFSILPFAISHDVADPVGYIVRSEGKTYFHATDLGAPLESVGQFLAQADAATLESNHEPTLVIASSRPECLKRRILGPLGHLSNDQCAALVAKYASPKLKRLSLAHLSEQCNEPHLAERAARAALAKHPGVQLEILSQCKPGKTWEV